MRGLLDSQEKLIATVACAAGATVSVGVTVAALLLGTVVTPAAVTPPRMPAVHASTPARSRPGGGQIPQHPGSGGYSPASGGVIVVAARPGPAPAPEPAPSQTTPAAPAPATTTPAPARSPSPPLITVPGLLTISPPCATVLAIRACLTTWRET